MLPKISNKSASPSVQLYYDPNNRTIVSNDPVRAYNGDTIEFSLLNPKSYPGTFIIKIPNIPKVFDSKELEIKLQVSGEIVPTPPIKVDQNIDLEYYVCYQAIGGTPPAKPPKMSIRVTAKKRLPTI